MDEKTRRFKRVEKLFTPEPDLVAVEELADLIASRPVRSRIQERLRPEPGIPTRIEEIQEVMPEPKRPSFKTLDRTGYPVRQSFDLIKATRPGFLHEITLRSPSSDFRIFVEGDGKEKLKRTYAELAVLSPYSNTIDAFQEHDTLIYTVHIQKMDWKSDFLFNLTVDTTIIFENIWAHWVVME